ncbi:MAG: GIY-YIG nuclease family protein [Candidatus Bathyarchaeia archaeon]
METRGIYLLIISISGMRRIEVGSLGTLTFEGGLYAYVGSAQNNLEKRIERHFNKYKQAFWHIDYLLNNENAEIINVLFKDAPKSEECQLALALNSLCKPVRGFGSSDCKCPSHLFKVDNYEDIEMFLKRFGLNLFKRAANA